MDWAKYAPDMKPSDGFDGELAKLPDADYLFEIGEIEEKERGGQLVIEMNLRVMTAGPHEGMNVKRPSFVKDQDGANRWLADLTRLGFDAELPRAGDANEQMAKMYRVANGMRFMGKKTTSEKNDKGKVFSNVNITARADDGKPAKIGAKELDELANEVSFG